MAPKDSQAPLDFLELLAPSDLPVLLACPLNPASSILSGLSGLKDHKQATLDLLDHPAPRDHRVTLASKALEVTLETAPVSEEAPRGCPGYRDPPEPTASPAFQDERASPVTPAHPVWVLSQARLVVLEREASLVARERKALPSFPTLVWG